MPVLYSSFYSTCSRTNILSFTGISSTCTWYGVLVTYSEYLVLVLQGVLVLYNVRRTSYSQSKCTCTSKRTLVPVIYSRFRIRKNKYGTWYLYLFLLQVPVLLQVVLLVLVQYSTVQYKFLHVQVPVTGGTGSIRDTCTIQHNDRLH